MKTNKKRGLLLPLVLLLCLGMLHLPAFAEEAVSEPDVTAAAEELPAAPSEGTTAVEADTKEADAAAPPAGGETTGEAQTEKPTVTFLPGDVSGDDAVDAEDARIALRIAVGIETYADNAPQLRAADLDGTPGVSAADARLILRMAVGLTEAAEGKDHVHVFEKTVVEPTCTEEGYTLVKCIFCDESRKEDPTPPKHHYYKFYCTVCGQMDPLHVKSEFATDFERVLYDHSHALFYKTGDELANTPGVGSGSLLEYVYHRVGKWCCYYTIHDVFRPALKKAGYSDQKIEQIAPVFYSADKIDKMLRNATSIGIPIAFLGTGVPIYVPSMLLDYYIGHPQYAKTYIFREYYDDMVEQRLYQPTDNRTEYKPRVGDILFMSNKQSTYVNGYPTVDHTAQIIMMYDDGSFWCTEGSLIQSGEDGLPRVRERMYFFNNEIGAYEYRYNPVVVVLAVAQPDLYDDFSFGQ